MGEKSKKRYGSTSKPKSFVHHDFNRFNKREGSKDTIDKLKKYVSNDIGITIMGTQLPLIQGGEKGVIKGEVRDTNGFGIKKWVETEYATGQN